MVVKTMDTKYNIDFFISNQPRAWLCGIHILKYQQFANK